MTEQVPEETPAVEGQAGLASASGTAPEHPAHPEDEG